MATESTKRIARAAAEAFGGTPKVTRYWDEPDQNYIDLLEVRDSPVDGVTSYATLGLSEFPLVQDGEEYPVRVELLGACATEVDYFAKVVTTAAFCVSNDQWFSAPGIVFPDVVAMYAPAGRMRHVIFVPPFLWDEALGTLELPNRTVAWLLVVPISDSELTYADTHGSDALEDLFERKQIDIFDIDRAPVA
jgi:antitoxin YqcF